MGSLQKGRWTKMFSDRANQIRVIGNFYLNHIYIGHGVSGEHQSRFFQRNPTCRCGEEIETVEHLLKKCKLWTRVWVNWPKGCPNFNTVDLMQILSVGRTLSELLNN
ncbi:hypothetical protein AVEN_173585-1 [Araneus ventricosus]|uniref:Uncharacterized protein n=1 Tax=Araneus ventricosus TaxID=182803 RepID=A0A4Y2CSH4_ARAVE|nr:hypothetical protein AVEN_173585-1 [Araneus ventricosus]